MIRRVLIANRGEIAVRVIRACKELGIETVAVYSEADAAASHVLLANEAVAIGPSAANASYLNAAAIIEAATKSGSDAVHPGYGFLSENADFARACEARGLVFIGPSSTVIERMGSKTAAREAVAKAGVPVVPGDTPKNQEAAGILASLKHVGYPALLKASAGGGGKGMRIVRSDDEADDAIASARSEAERSFADGRLYVERLIERPRHIEVQIMADRHGSTVHLFERDCTLQRRHQKVIEEAPGPTVTPAIRERMTRAAVAAAQAVGYVNAGTIEFLLSGDDFYFLEMNTRLQVEHPITEAVTGVDLVRAQLLVASGEKLPFSQPDLSIRGAAVECRVYAEDPASNFLPQAGPLLRYREPQGPGVRVDAGVAEGQAITVHYDPMIAKVITSGENRDAAWARAVQALRSFEILGLKHNISFLLALLRHPDVVACRTHTRWIEEQLDELVNGAAKATPHAAAPDTTPYAVALAALLGTTASHQSTRAPEHQGTASAIDPWRSLGKVDW
jgi:3-methylcrotonyl-CoA carboxylase alpha subunit